MKRLVGYPWEAVRALELPAGNYAVFGSAPLLAWGLVTEVGDIDILATRSAWRLACRLGTPVLAPDGDRVVHLASDIDIFNGWFGLDTNAVIRRAEMMDGLPIAQLSDVGGIQTTAGPPQRQGSPRAARGVYEDPTARPKQLD